MFVVGCHRSGTSLVSGLLSDVLRAQRSNDLDSTVDNPRGYFESTLLREFNDNLLSLIGSRWDTPPIAPPYWSQGRLLQFLTDHKREFESYATSSHWVDKDPRLSITFPAYHHLLLRRVPCVLALRHPLEVALSLYYRDGFSLDKGLLLWYLYNRHASLFLHESVDFVISYDLLLSADSTHLDAFSDYLASHSPDDRDARQYLDDLHHSCAGLAQPALKRNNVDGKVLMPPVPIPSESLNLCISIYERIAQTGFNLNSFQQEFQLLPAVLVDTSARTFSEGEPSLEFGYRHDIRRRPTRLSGISSECQTGDLDIDNQFIYTYQHYFETLRGSRIGCSTQLVPPVDDPSLSSSELGETSLVSLVRQLEACRSDLDAIRNSLIWRLSSPIRKILDRLKLISLRS